MTKHVADDRTDHLDVKTLKRFEEAGRKDSGEPGAEARALHRHSREPDQSRAKQYARIERGRTA